MQTKSEILLRYAATLEALAQEMHDNDITSLVYGSRSGEIHINKFENIN